MLHSAAAPWPNTSCILPIFFMRTGRYGGCLEALWRLSEKYSDVEDIAAHSKESKEAYVKYLEMSAKDEKELQNDSMFQRFKNWL